MDLEPNTRYDMPANFGPSRVPDVEAMFSVECINIPFITDPGALARYLPEQVKPTDVPVVSVSYSRCTNLAWMGGRDYNIVAVYATVIYEDDSRRVEAPISLAIWETDCAPIIAGREFLGTPKLFGQIPDVGIGGKQYAFSCLEYESLLIHGSVSDMVPVSAAELERAQPAAKDVVRLHWKYIPGVSGSADADYIVAMHAANPLTQLWKGAGTVEFGSPDSIAAPYSSHIVESLNRLPVLEYRRATAFVSESATLFRDKTERLD